MIILLEMLEVIVIVSDKAILVYNLFSRTNLDINTFITSLVLKFTNNLAAIVLLVATFEFNSSIRLSFEKSI